MRKLLFIFLLGAGGCVIRYEPTARVCVPPPRPECYRISYKPEYPRKPHYRPPPRQKEVIPPPRPLGPPSWPPVSPPHHEPVPPAHDEDCLKGFRVIIR
ncbi:MAG: hypothetical protein K0S38_103 [Candidatus Paceibacter sp.]|jgi:hypothetical protein|nr:hypothetical protein [Candidatus Paceibacter sp.]